MKRLTGLISFFCILGLLSGCGLASQLLELPERDSALYGAEPGGQETVEFHAALYSDGVPAVLWGRDQLSVHAQATYDKIERAAASRQETPVTVDVDEDEIQLILTALRMDHPEYFWFDGKASFLTTSVAGVAIKTECTLSYTMDLPEIQEAHQNIRQYAAACLSRLSQDGARTDYEKIMGVYRYLIETTDYVRSEEDQSIVSAMVSHRATCAGYARSFQGVFYRQYILGEWVSAEGAVYPMWDEKENTYDETDPGMYRGMRRFCAIDYGTTNPCVFLDVRDDGHTFFIAGEYYWDSAARRRQKTDAEYADDLYAFLEGDLDTLIIVDPSASSFKAELRNRGFRIQDAVNAVREGISTTATLIGNRQVKAERTRCPALQREIQSYVWDEKARLRGEERPLKERDHAMDALRYLCHTRTNRFRRLPE